MTKTFTIKKHFRAPISGKKSTKMMPASMYRIVSRVDGRVLVPDFIEENAETAAGLYISGLALSRIIRSAADAKFVDGDTYAIAGLREGHPASEFAVELVRA